MTTLTTTKAKLLFVEVPDDADKFYLEQETDEDCATMVVLCKISSNPIIDLPSGSTYTFLFTTKQATEEDWKGVVDEWWQYNTITGTPVPVNIIGYKDYDIEAKDYDMVFTATESGLSLQQANGIDVNKNYAVIKID